MLHSVPKMLRTCSRVVGVFGDMFLHSVPKKGVLAFRAEKGGLRRPVLNTESCNTPKKGISWNAHIPGVGAEKGGSCIPCRKKESPGMRIFQESVPNMRIPRDILII